MSLSRERLRQAVVCGLVALASLLISLQLVVADEPAAAELVKPTSVEKLVANNLHNAFTALIKWKDQYWLAFRQAKEHNTSDGEIVLMRSSDGNKWEETRRVNILPDDRDPQFVATADRLFLYIPAMQGQDLTSYVTYTDDGQNWSEPVAVYQPRYIMWKPTVHDGKFYAAVHLKSNDGKERDVHLVTSPDGVEWEKISLIRGGNWESETTIFFERDGQITAFLRQKYGSPRSSLLMAKPPYTEWMATPGNITFGGHAIHTFKGANYFFSRASKGSDSVAMIYTYADGKLTPYCELPSGGDCSYPEAVQMGDEMLVSYYSSHEGKTNIYLAHVPLLEAKNASERGNGGISNR
jgi:hypothetical protein